MFGQKPVGNWSNFYESGQLSSKGKWKENGLDSIWTFYRENGEISKTISYERNFKNGNYTVYDSSNLIQFQGFYVNDTLQGPFKKYKDGQLIQEGNYVNGELNGWIKEINPTSGLVASIVEFKNGEAGDARELNRTVDGKRIGLWQWFDANGDLIKQEIYTDGALNGSQKQSVASFKFEKKYFSNGQLKARYMIQNGYKNGIQTNYDSLGNTLAAFEYRNDTLLSEGWFTKEGLKDSLWIEYLPNQVKAAKGNYKNGQKEGLWIYYFPNGYVEQKGRYQQDLPTGEWLWYYPNGQLRRQENFYKGQYEGEVLDYDSLGTLLQSRNFTYNTLDGDLYYFIGDHKEKGNMVNGFREGKWVYFYGNKKKAFVGKYKDGLPEGKHKFWFENGRIAYVIHYKKGKLNGKKLEYFENGGLNHNYIYKNGTLKYVDGERLVEKNN
jgi:uncharacterized protein